MIVVAHRRNTIEALRATPTTRGVEVDVRCRGDRLVVAHDPFEDGPAWDDWLSAYSHALLVVNLKEEGLAPLVLPTLAARGIETFFLLGPDPGEALGLSAADGRIAVRVSEVHHPATALGLASQLRWVWLDGFYGFPVDDAVIHALRAAGYRICLVSPELYGRPAAEIEGYQRRAAACGPFDAVCTREFSAWEHDSQGINRSG